MYKVVLLDAKKKKKRQRNLWSPVYIHQIQLNDDYHHPIFWQLWKQQFLRACLNPWQTVTMISYCKSYQSSFYPETKATIKENFWYKERGFFFGGEGGNRDNLTVSVAKRAFTRPSWKRISTNSLITGRRPEWWTAIPRWSSGNINSMAGKFLSSSFKHCIAFRKTSSTVSFSSWLLKSSLDMDIACCSHSLLLKLKMITGWNFRSIIIWKKKTPTQAISMLCKI